MNTLIRVLTWVIALLIGAVYGTAGTIAQAYTLGAVPVGLILALIGIAAMLVAMRGMTADRWAALAGGVGALAATVLFSGTGPGGSVVVPAVAKGEINLGLVWGIGLIIVAIVVVAWPDVSRAHSSTGN
ncbi:DUF6113 family protein [Microbacterium horticulturae]|uniref:DUF6113 family protein n=1 Tax=Microbacterium horticulturae TaxID=3028316 RepID=A0ABY8C2Y8_9MICO|nr:DUF6113 family protein [Microbacterium sp. KACC 23027]WEG10670.1 DUF6113 family protein [Microbacterium sp. KACC 23027]